MGISFAKLYSAATVSNILIFALLYLAVPSLRGELTEEDHFLENAQATLFFASFLLGLIAFFRWRKKRERLASAVILLAGLVTFLDEISFGERLFNIKMPVVYLLKHPREVTIMGENVRVELPRTFYRSQKDLVADIEKWSKSYRVSHPGTPKISVTVRKFKFDAVHDAFELLRVAYGWRVAFPFLAMSGLVFIFLIRKMRPHPAVPYVLICAACVVAGTILDLLELPLFWSFVEELSEFNGSLALLFGAASAYRSAG